MDTLTIPARAVVEVAKYSTPLDDVMAALNLHEVADLSAFTSEQQLSALIAQGARPTDVLEREHNLLMYGGASLLWEAVLGNGTGTAGQALTFLNNANAAIGVGDSTTAAAAGQTDLQATANKLRKAMDAAFPTHTDGVVAGSAAAVFRSTFGTGDANWAWNEWGLFNSATAATGRMYNRKVESLGTKTSSGSWQFTATLSLA